MTQETIKCPSCGSALKFSDQARLLGVVPDDYEPEANHNTVCIECLAHAAYVQSSDGLAMLPLDMEDLEPHELAGAEELERLVRRAKKFPDAAWPEGQMEEWELDSMIRCGFYMHHVHLGRSGHGSRCNSYVNCHTHGIPESWPGQLDLQIVADVGFKSCGRIMWDFVDRIKEGERFHDGDRVEDILVQPVLLKKFPEGHPDRGEVLRILIPTKEATLPGDPGHPNDFFSLQDKLDTENPGWETISCRDLN